MLKNIQIKIVMIFAILGVIVISSLGVFCLYSLGVANGELSASSVEARTLIDEQVGKIEIAIYFIS